MGSSGTNSSSSLPRLNVCEDLPFAFFSAAQKSTSQDAAAASPACFRTSGSITTRLSGGPSPSNGAPLISPLKLILLITPTHHLKFILLIASISPLKKLILFITSIQLTVDAVL